MPIWSEEELLQAARLLEFSDTDSILKKYNLFGGISWYCFNDVLDEVVVKEQIAKLRISQINSIAVDIDLSHIIFHRYVASDPDTTFTTTDATENPDIHVKFPSDEIAKMVYEHLSSKEKDYMIKYFEIELSGPYSSLSGIIFERFIHDYIFKFVHLLANQKLLRLVAKPHFSLQICRKYHQRKDCIADLCEATKKSSIQSCHLIKSFK